MSGPASAWWLRPLILVLSLGLLVIVSGLELLEVLRRLDVAPTKI